MLTCSSEQIHQIQIYSFISTELPDASEDPELFDIIKYSMVHGPCGNLSRDSPGMVDGTCSKSYPKPFLAETET